jgi:hypothetical protein
MQNRHALKRARPAVHSNLNSALTVPEVIYAQGKIFYDCSQRSCSNKKDRLSSLLLALVNILLIKIITNLNSVWLKKSLDEYSKSRHFYFGETGDFYSELTLELNLTTIRLNGRI